MFLYIDSFIDSFMAGKTMENLRNRRTVDLVISEEKLKKFEAQPSFKQFKIVHENLVAVEPAKVEIIAELTNPCWIHHPGSFENADVWFPLQLH